jgi:hypothetical protein
MIPMSVLVLVAVVVLPLASLLVDLAFREVARSRQRITDLVRSAADGPMPTRSSATDMQEGPQPAHP